MMHDKIGENAGNIWSSLSGKGTMSPTAIKKETKLNDRDLNMALGWLAREEKLDFAQKGNQTLISLK